MAKKRPSAPKQNRNWKGALVWGFRLVVPTLIGAVSIYGLLLLAGNLIDSPLFELREIQYEGVRHLDEESLNILIHSDVPQSLWLIDLARIRYLVESEDWVRSAVVRRQFPDTIQVFVTEREPIAVAAIGEELRVVDRDGALLDSYGPKYSDLDRPIVTGLKNTALENAREENQKRMRTYLRLLAEMDDADPAYTQQLSEVDVSDPERIAVVPAAQAIPVYLGSERFVERYRIFLSQTQLLEQLRQQHGAIESVDLTYENQIIVHTPEASQAATEQPTTS